MKSKTVTYVCIPVVSISLISFVLVWHADLLNLDPHFSPKDQKEALIPYSSLSDIRQYIYLKNGVEGQEHKYNISHSLQNRFQFPIQPEATWTLPSLLHFIWVGPVIREKYVDSINLFSTHNPNYKVILWTDDKTLHMNESYKFRAEVETRNMTALIPQMVNCDIMPKLGNVGAVTDLMKYEIVYMFGGVYTDTDSHSLKPIGENLRYSFTAPGVPPGLIPAGIFGFPKGSRFLLFVMAAARERFLSPEFSRFPVYIQFGPTFLSTAFLQFNDTKIRMISANYLLQWTANVSIMYQTNDQSWG